MYNVVHGTICMHVMSCVVETVNAYLSVLPAIRQHIPVLVTGSRTSSASILLFNVNNRLLLLSASPASASFRTWHQCSKSSQAANDPPHCSPMTFIAKHKGGLPSHYVYCHVQTKSLTFNIHDITRNIPHDKLTLISMTD